MKSEPLKNKIKWRHAIQCHCMTRQVINDDHQCTCLRTLSSIDTEDVRDAVEWLKQKVYRFSEDEGINMSTDDCIALIELAFEDVVK